MWCNQNKWVDDDAIRLKLFPFTWKDEPQIWLYSLPTNPIITRDSLYSLFLTKYFSLAKTKKYRREILNFKKRDGESLCKTWYSFKDLLRICPRHGLRKELIVAQFYDGLDVNTKNFINASSDGVLMNKKAGEAFRLKQMS